ncbi:Dynamin, GTPase domain protein [Moelleriella libera RCEF 2490]|uniref:Dynamin, GTPase domain protein n=1 Tax=Moelleriella libera RCEF 2490 TaxID=1081109 RepID=A0A162IKE6_9HYPO|nr:Dynamin, GTPase domain protein [Moelleriella libera RCEF 2490]
MSVSVKSEPGTFSSPERLHKIDQLREKNVGTHMPLPQLVVVGDQSSGKSSLLETLTGIPFPNAQGLCTRYATQITHRRDVIHDILVSIIPVSPVTDDRKQRLLAYNRSVKSTALLQKEYESIIRQVDILMDIKSKDNPQGRESFSRHILKIESQGPDEDYLTVIDVPGIFRNIEEGVTKDADRKLVMDMVESYVKQERTIILAVLPCNADVMTQEVLSLAEKYDEAGKRTLGVLTKPDLLPERNTKLVVCDLINGKKRPLNLGYYLIVNRGADEVPGNGSNTHEREAVFKTDPWSSLPPDRVGVAALRKRLQDLLHHITDKEFPKLRADARRILAAARESVDSLGSPRQSQRDLRLCLGGMAHDFQSNVRKALEANYSYHSELKEDRSNLVTEIIDITRQFNEDFMAMSSTWSFDSESREQAANYDSESSDSEDSDLESLDEQNNTVISAANIYPELESIIDLSWKPARPKRGLMSFISSYNLAVRRAGGGSPDLLSFFRHQSTKWERMAKFYVSRVILVIHRHINLGLGICEDPKVREGLKSTLEHDLIDRYRAAIKQVVFLVSLERDTKPYTVNGSFDVDVQKALTSRIVKPLQAEAARRGDRLRASDIGPVVERKTDGQHESETIHERLKTYYDIARRRFVNNIFHQAVQHCLLSGPKSPLRLFSWKWVDDLDDKSLESIAVEPHAITGRRKQLKRKIDDLEAALEILR